MKITKDVIAVLKIVKKGEFTLLDKPISEAVPGMSSVGRSQLSRELEHSGLIRQTDAFEYLTPQSGLSDDGERILRDFSLYEGLDKIIEKYHQLKEEGNDSAFSFAEICKLIDLKHDDDYTCLYNEEMERGFMFLKWITTDKTNGASYVVENSRSWRMRHKSGRFFSLKYLDDINKDNETMESKRAQTRHSENNERIIENIHIHRAEVVSFGSNTTNQVTNIDSYHKTFLDQAFPFSKTDKSNLNESEIQNFNEMLSRFETLLFENLKLTRQGKGFVSDQIDEIRELIAKEDKGGIKKFVSKVFENILGKLGAEGALSMGHSLYKNGELANQYWQLFLNSIN